MEVDFILGKAQIAIEAKAKEKISLNDLKNPRQFKREYPPVEQLIVVSLEKNARRTKDGILILPYQKFIQKLWQDTWKI